MASAHASPGFSKVLGILVSWTARRSIADPSWGEEGFTVYTIIEFSACIVALSSMESASMRCPNATLPEQQQCIEEADFDLDLVQRRVDDLRALLLEACQESQRVCLRLSRLDIETKSCRYVQARAQEMLAACRSACIHLDLPIDRR